ncbi:hypothetical protein M9H77_30978 [Catharanthus roseus]|uniref:Uncharacterized protein n=1 Tax=Catharanthus roseus TaxID=4058 RepID=A0ACC0A2Q5_CATRO|nr:hypothetical protein M9H77_30978 [Catharanthus roseus]
MVEEKGRLITIPTRCFKYNGVGYIVVDCPAKRTLVFNEDLNSWIEKSDNDCLASDDLRTNVLKPLADDVNRTSKSPLEAKRGPITRAQRRKLKALEDNSMVAYLEEAFKNKLEEFEGQERVSKLFSKRSISKNQTGSTLEEKLANLDSPRFSVGVLKLQNPQQRFFMKEVILGRFTSLTSGETRWPSAAPSAVCRGVCNVKVVGRKKGSTVLYVWSLFSNGHSDDTLFGNITSYITDGSHAGLLSHDYQISEYQQKVLL